MAVAGRGCPRDRDVDLKRIGSQLDPVQVEQAGQTSWRRCVLVKGYIGPQLREAGAHLVDPLVVDGSAWVTSANAEAPRAIQRRAGPRLRPGRRALRRGRDLRRRAAGPRCGAPLEIGEGHRTRGACSSWAKYAETFSSPLEMQNGKPVTITMGSYGVSHARWRRLSRPGEKGLCWPRGVGPADVRIVATGKGGRCSPRPASPPNSMRPACARDVRRPARRHRASSSRDAELIRVPTVIEARAAWSRSTAAAAMPGARCRCTGGVGLDRRRRPCLAVPVVDQPWSVRRSVVGLVDAGAEERRAGAPVATVPNSGTLGRGPRRTAPAVDRATGPRCG